LIDFTLSPVVALEIAKGSFVLAKDDIVELGSRVRHMGIIDFARAVKLYYATQKRGTTLCYGMKKLLLLFDFL
jgi:hypothetical protein